MDNRKKKFNEKKLKMLNDILDRHMAGAHAIPHTGHLSKKILYAKLIYCNHPSKNVEHPNLRITKIWVQQK